MQMIAGASQKRSGAAARRNAPPDGPTMKPSCHEKPLVAMYRPVRPDGARSATSGP
jgi:hypothetical protein